MHTITVNIDRTAGWHQSKFLLPMSLWSASKRTDCNDGNNSNSIFRIGAYEPVKRVYVDNFDDNCDEEYDDNHIHHHHHHHHHIGFPGSERMSQWSECMWTIPGKLAGLVSWDVELLLALQRVWWLWLWWLRGCWCWWWWRWWWWI